MDTMDTAAVCFTALAVVALTVGFQKRERQSDSQREAENIDLARLDAHQRRLDNWARGLDEKVSTLQHACFQMAGQSSEMLQTIHPLVKHNLELANLFRRSMNQLERARSTCCEARYSAQREDSCAPFCHLVLNTDIGNAILKHMPLKDVIQLAASCKAGEAAALGIYADIKFRHLVERPMHPDLQEPARDRYAVQLRFSY